MFVEGNTDDQNSDSSLAHGFHSWPSSSEVGPFNPLGEYSFDWLVYVL